MPAWGWLPRSSASTSSLWEAASTPPRTSPAVPWRPRRLRIGRFGIGVCAAFLLGTEVQVITRHLTASGDRAVCLRFVERDDTTEMYRCAAPVGTTVRVRLSEEAYQRLTGDPDL